MSFLYRIDCLHIKAEYTNVAVFVEKMRENRYDIINDVIKKIDLVRIKLLQDPEARLSKVQTL